MRKKDMRVLLDEEIIRMEAHLAALKLLRAEMHNRPPVMHGRATARTVDYKLRERIRELHRQDPTLPQHEIAWRLQTTPQRVSETLAGKRT